jgi:polysaccharide deacetylase family protein (PEP-CTERM system associated)
MEPPARSASSQATDREPFLRNFLTLDIEEWYHSNYEGCATPVRPGETRLEALVDRLIELCSERGVRTTCFVLGSVAEAKPGIVRKLHAAGHEIASHGYGHELVHPMGPSRFASDLRVSCEILEALTGEKVLGYRAPSFSVTEDALAWYYDTLEAAGLAYSSSVFPGRTFLYGVPGFPERIHRPVVSGQPRKIVEFPVPAVHIAGNQIGLYFRLFPGWAIARRIARDNRAGRPVILYVHPREIDPEQPRLELPFWPSVIHYWGIRGCEAKLRSVLTGASFGRMKDAAQALGVA